MTDQAAYNALLWVEEQLPVAVPKSIGAQQWLRQQITRLELEGEAGIADIRPRNVVIERPVVFPEQHKMFSAHAEIASFGIVIGFLLFALGYAFHVMGWI